MRTEGFNGVASKRIIVAIAMTIAVAIIVMGIYFTSRESKYPPPGDGEVPGQQYFGKVHLEGLPSVVKPGEEVTLWVTAQATPTGDYKIKIMNNFYKETKIDEYDMFLSNEKKTIEINICIPSKAEMLSGLIVASIQAGIYAPDGLVYDYDRYGFGARDSQLAEVSYD